MIKHNGYYLYGPYRREARNGIFDFLFIAFIFNQDGTLIRAVKTSQTEEIVFEKNDFKEEVFKHSYQIKDNGVIITLYLNTSREFKKTLNYLGNNKFSSEDKNVLIRFKSWE